MVDELSIAIKESGYDLPMNFNLKKLVEKPKMLKNGDYAFPVFGLSKIFHLSPDQVAFSIYNRLNKSDTNFEKIEHNGAYINFFLDRKREASTLISDIINNDSYGKNNAGNKKTIIVELSSPNIAKPMSMGHLRSTMIGESLSRIANENGYKTIKINHLGDWGTQFGLMIEAYKLWGNKDIIEQNPVDELVKLYVRINKEAETNPELSEAGRSWFKKLEDGDPEARELWKWFKNVSLREFNKVYQRLGVTFDSMNGESFYQDKMSVIIDLLKNKGILTESRGAQIVDLPSLLPAYNLPVSIILRSDGATQYATRDLATAFYRQTTYHFDKCLYVVGAEQKEYFKQIKAILKLAGFNWSDDMEHIYFGLITFNGKKMSTRKGNVVKLEQVLDSAHKLAKNQIAEKNPNLSNSDKVAEQVGTGAVIFNDLMNDRTLSIDFDLDQIVKFEGDTGPYVQYTHVRAVSILRKSSIKIDINDAIKLLDNDSWAVVSKLSVYPDIVKRAWILREPSIIAKYLLNLAHEFNSYYSKVHILVEDKQLSSRLALVDAVAIVLKKGLELLDVQAPDQM
ncbi:arginine--tRNA ligase [Oenococcus oeni]|uniref:arginine--tRNA ligase n=1 Tax=Oenococcus oeni TaxID=1247 RepID=UPI0008F82518|nr:arginine--tRNA ligase [Oenococcus oeni]OIL24341.1 arginine--tRNA ligase [Oenococcus oeni]OIL68771.1 arginine--tRNA ligase [Oenococcus oeni]OIM11843.1 arginine--tRNA ligase [Oenococcus oeni]OIM39906.1 arginine--tRNA ligase [Oenococcus oeni]